ncbi:restriction modification system DNA specificity domain protein [Ruminiclostridium cellulolyticum H10]|uniref:Restriction modification system DNA specificity domain protein n=1 Tax=Ruminiclostridium cellulolyticum (strain ATCC 35319 / DSM 5812 / JCM 6584 / H10) TaxID=394503 RepID=B8I7G2_RUMCH|nr:restriction modification system DNA specificity domain protein [Ruminiclostridium cellulolyticum H10]
MGEMAEETYGGGTPSTLNKAYWNGNIPWIQSSDLVEHQLFGVSPRKYITESGVCSSAAKLVPENSIAIVTRVGVGKLATMPFAFATSQDFLSLSNLKCEIWFFAYSIYKKLQRDIDAVQGTSIKGITKNELLSKSICAPSDILEQTSIGNFLHLLDDAITLHKRKLDDLKDLKHGYLQQMFPQAGESVPLVRFAGFTEPWQKRTLGDVAEIVGGGTPDTANPAYWNGNIEWFSPTEIGTETYASISHKKISELGLKNSSAKMLTGGSTILFTSRAGIGDMAILTRPAATNQGFQSLEIRKTFDVYFIYSMGSKIKEYALKNASGSTFLEISGKNLGRMKLRIPTFKEQTAIGNFFRNLDDQITAQKQKLSQLKQLKFAYLQKMLI